MLLKSILSLAVCALAPSALNAIASDASPAIYFGPPWIGSATVGSVVLLAEAQKAQIDRYDIVQRAWLTPIALPSVPTAFTVAGNTLIVSDANATTRYAVDGTQAQTLPGALPYAQTLGNMNGILVEAAGQNIQTYDLTNLVQIDSANSMYSTPFGFVIDTALGRAIGVNGGWLAYWNIAANGSLAGNGGEVPVLNIQMGSRDYASADGTATINSGGTVYADANFVQFAAVGGAFDALVPDGSDRIVLRGAMLYRFDANFRERGRHALSAAANELVSDGSNVYAFRVVATQPQVERVALAAIVQPILAAPADPLNVPYAADQAELAPNGVLYLLSIAQRAIHRFDLGSWRYLPSVPLPDEPSRIAVDGVSGDLYVAYTRPTIDVLRAGSDAVAPFAYATLPLSGFGIAGSSLLTTDANGEWVTQRLLDVATGVQTTSVGWSHVSRQYAWCAQRGFMYGYDDGVDPNGLIGESVTPTAIGATSIGAPFNQTRADYPIRVDPTCNYVATGGGQVFDAGTLAITGTMSEYPVDIAWSGATMYDIVAGAANRTTVHRFDATHTTVDGNAGTIAGTPLRLLSFGANLYAVTIDDGRTLITAIAPALTGNDLSVFPDGATPAPAPGALAAVEFAFFNQGPAGPTPATIAIGLPAGLSSIEWLCQPEGASQFACGSDAPLAVTPTLAAGQRFDVVGYFTAPAAQGALAFPATITAASGDPVPQDDTTTIVLRLDHLFADGFEQ